MRFLLFAVLIFMNISSVAGQKLVEVSVLSFEDISPKAIKTPNQDAWLVKFPERDVLPGNRRVVFRISNKSSSPVKIYGDFVGAHFIPAGFLDEFDPATRKWKFEMSITDLDQAQYLMKYGYTVLKENESLDFTVEIRSLDDGKSRKRIIYYSPSNCDQPTQVESSEFSFSKRTSNE